MHKIKKLLTEKYQELPYNNPKQWQSFAADINREVSLKLADNPIWIKGYQIVTEDKCEKMIEEFRVKDIGNLIEELAKNAKKGRYYKWIHFKTLKRFFEDNSACRKKNVLLAFLNVPFEKWNIWEAIDMNDIFPKANNSLEGKYYLYYTKPNDKGKLQRIVLSVGCAKDGVYPCQLHSNSDDVVEAKFRGKYLYIEVFYADLGQTATQVYFLGKEKSPALAIGSGFDFTSSGFPFQSQSLLLKQASEEINQDDNCTFSLIDTESLQHCSEAEMVVINYFRHLKSEQGKWDTMTPPDVFSVEALRDYLVQKIPKQKNLDAFVGKYQSYYMSTDSKPLINKCIFILEKDKIGNYVAHYQAPMGNIYLSEKIDISAGVITMIMRHTISGENTIFMTRLLIKPKVSIFFSLNSSRNRTDDPLGLKEIFIRTEDDPILDFININQETTDKETTAVINYFKNHETLLTIGDKDFNKADFIEKWG